MILNTRRLFCRLLRTLDVATVCDVGSMDGADAMRFRRVLPSAEIIALEPNPRNLALMDANADLRRNSIRVLPLAASNRISVAPFFVVNADYTSSRQDFRRGMSSLHQRHERSSIAEVVQVQTTRLDKLLAEEAPGATSIALWIDVEGMGFEAVDGAMGVLAATRMVHIEVETTEVIGMGQKLFPHIEDALTAAGFHLLATDQPRHKIQFNALFVHSNALRTRHVAVRSWTWLFRLRRLVGTVVHRRWFRRTVPARLPIEGR